MDAFIVGMMENTDHNPSSTTAADYFHGTSIALAQPLCGRSSKPDECTIDAEVQGKWTIVPLPAAYTMFFPAQLRSEIAIPPSTGPCKLEIPQADTTEQND